MTYYWKTPKAEGDAYHWHKDCDKNHFPGPWWTSGSNPPSDYEECNECKAKDED